jgi:hypothetical protein
MWVSSTSRYNEWSMDASHEALELEDLLSIKVLDESSRALVLPAGFEGQRNAFAIVTTSTPKRFMRRAASSSPSSAAAATRTLRLSAESEEEMEHWLSVMNSIIDACVKVCLLCFISTSLPQCVYNSSRPPNSKSTNSSSNNSKALLAIQA